MDAGFTVSWPELLNNQKKHGHNRELYAQQHAMNKRFESPKTFPAEYQNRPKKKAVVAIAIKAADLCERVNGLDEGRCPAHTHAACSFIDVQDEILFWMTLAVSQDYSGGFVSYGTWPELKVSYFTKAQTEGWCLLSRALFEASGIESRSRTERRRQGEIALRGRDLSR